LRFALFILKKGARTTCNCSVSMCKVTAAARVFRVRGSFFLEKTRLDSPKKRVVPKKSFSMRFKKKGARATCNCSVSMCKVTAAARVFRVRGSSFLEKTWLDSLKKRVQSKKSFHLSSKKSGARVTCNCSGRKLQSAAAG
jgi:SRSO17 transposase